MLSAFVLIKLMKIKQSLALSVRCNSHFFHLQPCWVSLSHTQFMKVRAIPEALWCPGPVSGCPVPLQMEPTTISTLQLFLETTQPALCSSFKIRAPWDAAGAFADVVWPAHCRVQGNKLSPLRDYFRAATGGPESHHCHMVCKTKLNNLCEVCKKNSEIRHLITLLQFYPFIVDV